ncbi:MAG TPA: RNA polymerase subunit sigma-70 [Acidimicrobiales bacterium]|nr:RNA polymerase subunit sigma-70 [Acidimicrobiales bacterium]
MSVVSVPDATAEFCAATQPHRRELLVHCYQMLGSVHDAQDLVQETMARAWRAYGRFDPGLASMRTWLYRIATNACLSALETRARRPLPSGVGQPFDDPEAPFVPGLEVPWLQPFPDQVLGARPADPESVAVERSRLRLALVAALQLLSAKQRAALILREVLGYSAAEVAEMLETSVPAVNSALQRARAGLDQAGVSADDLEEPEAARQRVVEQYLAAFERADVEGLVRMLADEVVLEMPPMWNWYRGPSAYGRFMVRVFALRGTDWRVLPVAANGQPAMAAYASDGGHHVLHTLQVFTVGHGAIVRTTVFQDPSVFSLFGLRATLD